MSTVQKVAKNTIALIAGRILEIFISVFVAVYLARYLGTTGLGKYSLVYAYLSFFSFLTVFGMSDIVVREISKDSSKAEDLIGHALSLSLVLSIGAIGLAWLISNLLGYPSPVRFLIYIASLSMLFSPWSLYTSIFQVHLEQRYQVAVEVISHIILAGLVIILISIKALLIYFILVKLVISVIVAFGNRALSRRFIKPRWRIDIRIWKNLLKASWPLAFSGFLIAISMRIDQLMLYQMKGDSALGFYSAAVRPIELFNVVPLALSLSIFPLLSRSFSTNKEYFNKIYHASLKYMALFIVPIAFGLTIFSKDIIRLLYGKEFLPSSSVLALLVWSRISIFPGMMYHQVIITTGNQRFTFIATFINASINTILNLILIPKYSFIGAALATTISEIAIRFIMCFFQPVREYAVAPIKCLFKPLIGSIFMAGILYLLSLSFGLSILIAPFIYAGAMLFIKGINRDDLEIFYTLIGKKKVTGYV